MKNNINDKIDTKRNILYNKKPIFSAKLQVYEFEYF